ncbi:hypothetical protein [Roseibium sp. RKSG952]|uniref:hypothetical protein n=1 Tax=Roseibium sp. RKSG952 TaxID=2529384 RepID=UPI0012BB78A2|nr:hypothetical protein [Roseibium sp. RKSG952]MTH94871.1 hypothetical protein [Roseibium sp. RKSG952]
MTGLKPLNLAAKNLTNPPIVISEGFVSVEHSVARVDKDNRIFRYDPGDLIKPYTITIPMTFVVCKNETVRSKIRSAKDDPEQSELAVYQFDLAGVQKFRFVFSLAFLSLAIIKLGIFILIATILTTIMTRPYLSTTHQHKRDFYPKTNQAKSLIPISSQKDL